MFARLLGALASADRPMKMFTNLRHARTWLDQQRRHALPDVVFMQHLAGGRTKRRNFEACSAFPTYVAGLTMAQPPTENAEATKKRDLARRARRLAQTQMLAAERERLFKYADELDVEAETLEQGMRGPSLPPVAAVPQVQQQQVQQQQSADTSALTSEPTEKD